MTRLIFLRKQSTYRVYSVAISFEAPHNDQPSLATRWLRLCH